MHEPEKAIAAFQRALKLKPDWPACFNAMDDEYMNLKNYQEAVNSFRRATEKAPTSATYWNNLAAALEAMNKRDEALQALNSSEQSGAPRGANDWYVLGNGYYQLQEYPRAEHPTASPCGSIQPDSVPSQTSDARSKSKETGSKRYKVISEGLSLEIRLESRIMRIFRPESLKSRTGNSLIP